MRCLRCGVCCKETEMLLSEEDIKRLEGKGYDRDFFVRLDSEGYATLKNSRGCCVFYNAGKKRCMVYTNRPLGCRIYPVIFDEYRGIVADNICPNHSSVTDKQRERRGRKVLRLLEMIDAEAKKRANSLHRNG